MIWLRWRIYSFFARLIHGRHWPMSTDPIPPEDVARATELARQRGWADVG